MDGHDGSTTGEDAPAGCQRSDPIVTTRMQASQPPGTTLPNGKGSLDGPGQNRIKIARFEDLRPWSQSRRLASAIYQTAGSPGFRDRDLADQLRRAAVSVMSNIAEGFGSGSSAEFRRFLRYSSRSLSEIQSHLYVALDQKFVDLKQFRALYQGAAQIRELLREVEATWAEVWR